MFSKAIVLSDAFLDMPMSARCLYFTLSMLADDDGFVNSPKSVMRQCGASEDDFKILFGKNFLISFDSGLVVIKHWRINNYLRNDRYQQTNYREEKMQLSIEPNGSYHKIEGQITQQPVAIESLKIAEESNDLTEQNPVDDVIAKYKTNYQKLFSDGILLIEKPVINASTRKVVRDSINNYGLDTVLLAINKSLENDFCIKRGYCLTTILSTGVLSALVNVKEAPAKKTEKKIDKFANHPTNCSYCGEKLIDANGDKKEWFCMSCKRSWIFKKGNFIENIN